MIPVRYGRDSPSRFDRLCEGVIEASWLVVLLVAPIFFLAFSDRPFDPAKGAVIRVLATVAGAAWLAKVLTGGRPWRPTPAPSPTARRLLVAVLALVGFMVVGTALSPDPGLSWTGSYVRSLGTSTQLAAAVLFFLCVGHLRARAQIERIFVVVWWASVPVCLYALLQSLGLDPIAPIQALDRPASTLGNPIFLGAYLGITLFLGLALVCLVFSRSTGGRWEGLGQGVMIAVCGLQLWALVASASRGPILGVVAGLVLLSGYLIVTSWRRRGATAVPAVWRYGLTVAVLALIAAGSIPVIRSADRFLEADPMNTFRLPAESHLATTNSGTVQVRLILWRSALSAFRSPAPIVAAATEDHLHPWRPWIGYGQESVVYGLSHHVPLEMARLESARAPDQAHNQVLQTLMTGGLLGLVVWIFVQVLALAVGAEAMGASEPRTAKRSFVIVVVAGTAIGAVAPWVVLSDPSLSAVGGVAGALIAFGLWSLRAWWVSPRGGDTRRPFPTLLGAILSAAWLSHLVEGQFGIGVSTVIVYGWTTLAVLIVTAAGWVDRADTGDPVTRTGGSIPGLGIAAGLFVALLIYVFRIARLDGPDILWTQPLNQYAAYWIVVVSVIAGAVLGPDWRSAARMTTGVVAGAVGSFLALGVYGLVAGGSNEAAVVAVRVADVERAEGLLAFVFLFLIVVAALAWGWRLSLDHHTEGGGGPKHASPKMRLRTAAAILGCLLLVIGSWRHEARSIEASFLARGAMSLAMGRRFSAGMEMMEDARDLVPRQSRLALLQGRIAFDWATAARDPQVRNEALSMSEAELGEALELSPFDADHVANMGRWHLLAARFEPQARDREAHLDAGIDMLKRALVMRPGAVEWHRDLALGKKRRGDSDGAIEVLEQALRVLPTRVGLLVELADLHLQRASDAKARGDRELALSSAAEAERISESTVSMDETNGRARQILHASRALLVNPEN
jgi:O-antigen ligase